MSPQPKSCNVIQIHQSSQKTRSRRQNSPPTKAAALYLQSLSPNGRRAVRSILASAIRQLDGESNVETYPWQKLGYTELMSIKASMIEQHYAPRTINLVISSIRSIVRTSFYLGEIEAEQILRLDAIKPVRLRHNPAGRSLSKAEVRRLIAACKQHPSQQRQQRDRALLLVALGSGLRVSELQQLKIEDVCARRGVICVQSGKCNKYREVSLPPEARQALKAWLKTLMSRTTSTALWRRIHASGNIQNQLTVSGLVSIFAQLARTAAVAQFSPHDLRRTFITNMLNNGGDLNLVRQLAGHADISTTATYDRRQANVLKRLTQHTRIYEPATRYRTTVRRLRAASETIDSQPIEKYHARTTTYPQ